MFKKKTDPSGTMVQYEAKGIGAADEGLQTLLHEQYKGVRILFYFLIFKIYVFEGNGIIRCGKIGFIMLKTSDGRKSISLKKSLLKKLFFYALFK